MEKITSPKHISLIFLSLFILFIFPCEAFTKIGKESKNPVSISQIEQFMHKNKLLGFQENKGQIRDTEGDMASYVLYKAQAPNLNIWVTNTGLTYQFLKLSEDKELEKSNSEVPLWKVDDNKNGEWHRVDMIFKDVEIKKENIIVDGDITTADINYYVGGAKDGIYNVKTYTKITAKNIYPGIDWVLYTNNGVNGASLKQDFIVHSGADPNQIKLIYEGSGKFSALNNQIHFENPLGEINEGKLYCYQGNGANEILSKYKIHQNASLLNIGAGNFINEKIINYTNEKRQNEFSYEIGIETGNYNKQEDLIIDPQLFWCSFMGGASEYEAIMAMECDPRNGDLVTAGYVGSSEFPVLNMAGAYYQAVYATNRDGLILKFNNNGVLLWATFYGGNLSEHFHAICIDNSSNVYITGYSKSPDFPLFDPGNGAYYDATIGASGFGQDVFILKFNSSGARLWATFYGGSTDETGLGICSDNNGNIFITGNTSSSNFPTIAAPGAYIQLYNLGTGAVFDEAFILKFNSAGVRIWATFYGGTSWEYGNSVACDANGNVFMTGTTYSNNFPLLNPNNGAFYDATLASSGDAYIIKFDNNGVRLWATYIGGNNIDYGHSVKCDYANNVIMAGRTGATASFPSLNPGGGAYFVANSTGSTDAYILKFNNNGVQTWGTTYGGTGIENFGTFDNLAIDTCNNIFFTFNTQSTDIPTQNTSTCVNGYYDATANSSSPTAGDIFVLKLSSACVRLWATYVGGDGDDWREAIAIDGSSNIFIGGEWTNQGGSDPTSSTYPVTNPGGGAFYDPTWNGGQDDIYVLKFSGLNPNLLQAQSNSGGCNGCNGTATITVNCGDPHFSYVWSNGAQTLNTSSASNTVTGLCPGTYTVTVTSGCNSILTATFTIGGTFGIAPVVTASGNITINCTNPTGTISANATPVGSTYSWSGPGIVSGANTATATVNAGGIYTVIATYMGCSDTAAVTVINDNQPPVAITAGSQFEINCMYASDSITVISTTPGVTYSWSGPGIVSGGNTANPVVNQPGTYTVTVTNPANGCTSTATITVTQNTTIPNLTAGPPATLTCVVTSLTINASSTTNPVNYSWSGPGIVSGGNTSSPVVNQPGTYTVTVTNPQNFCTNTATVMVNQNIAIPNVLAGPGFMLTCTNTSGSISASSSTGGVTYSWTGPNVVSGGNTATATVNAQGTYTVTVTNPINGCTNTATVLVTSDNSIPNITVGPSLTLNCLILSGTINGSSTTPNATYSWSGPGVVSGGTTTTPTVNQPGTYVVTVTDPATGCTAVNSVLVINDNAPPVISATASSTITCTTTSDTIFVISTTTGSTYSWSGPGVVSGGTTSSPVVNTPGTYTVIVTNPGNGCTNTATVNVAIDTIAPNAVAGSPLTLTCAVTSDTIQVISSTGGVTYSWSGPGIVSGGSTSSPIVNTPGTYTVIVIDPSNGCTKTTSVLVNQNITTPNVTAGATATLTCTTTSLNISASSTTAGATYNWSGPNVISGGTTSSPVVGSIGTYTVIVTDPVNGCTNTAAVNVNNNLTPPNVTAGSSLLLHCNLTSSTITASSTVAGATYSWSGPGIVSGGNTQSPTVNQAGTYTVVVTDPSNGCTSSSTVTVSNAPAPYATVSPDVTIILGTSTQLLATGGPGYSWSPTTGLSCTTCADPIASPSDTTIYCVTVTDQYGCSDSACVKVNVVDPCPPTDKDFPIPNVFTPNEDDKNDLFYLKDWNNECIVEFSVEIYDRWGLKMFESNGNNVFWDGRTSSGLVTPAGTYYYVIKVRRLRDELKTYKGFVMLTR